MWLKISCTVYSRFSRVKKKCGQSKTYTLLSHEQKLKLWFIYYVHFIYIYIYIYTYTWPVLILCVNSPWLLVYAEDSLWPLGVISRYLSPSSLDISKLKQCPDNRMHAIIVKENAASDKQVIDKVIHWITEIHNFTLKHSSGIFEKNNGKFLGRIASLRARNLTRDLPDMQEDCCPIDNNLYITIM